MPIDAYISIQTIGNNIAGGDNGGSSNEEYIPAAETIMPGKEPTEMQTIMDTTMVRKSILE